jgi:D-threo-aldose 1-dehydrogenase
LDRIREIEAVCDRFGVALPAAALQFPASHPAVVSVLFGNVSPSQVAKAIDAFGSLIPADFGLS